MGYTKILLILFFLLGISACLPSGEKSPVEFRLNDRPLLPSVNAETPLSFTILKERIIDRKCLSCHSPPEPELDVDLSTYQAITEDRFVPILIKGKPLKSRFYKSIASGEMPPKAAPLSLNEMDYIKRWIENCAPEFEGDEVNCQDPGDDDDWDDDDDFGNDDNNDDFDNDDFGNEF